MSGLRRHPVAVQAVWHPMGRRTFATGSDGKVWASQTTRYECFAGHVGGVGEVPAVELGVALPDRRAGPSGVHDLAEHEVAVVA